MRMLLGLAIIGLTSASTLHYSPLILTKPEVTQELRDQLPATREYLNQDHQGFYSYGYSGDSSAKAEYKSIDGSSIGFYSYVDANGKLQTVEYVANRQHGFQAAATNLPVAPVDNRVGPTQVKDTPEVEEARRAHLEAHREAELRAANANSEGTQNQEMTTDEDNGDMGSSAELNSNENNTAMENEERKDDKNKEKQNNEGNNVNRQNYQNEQNAQDAQSSEKEQNGQDERMATLSIQNGLSNEKVFDNLNINTDSLAYLGNSLDLSLLYANGRELSYLEPYTTQYATLHPTTYETVQLPTQSYYSVLAPSTTRVLTNLPRLKGEIATTYGNTRSLPLALGTTYLSHGTYAKK